jgi:hypothetical protein
MLYERDDEACWLDDLRPASDLMRYHSPTAQLRSATSIPAPA